MSSEEPLAVGTVSRLKRKCGNPGCHCAAGDGHMQTIFLFKDQSKGKRRCKLVRKSDEDFMLRASEKYRNYRECLKELRTIDKQEKQILMALMGLRAITYV
jgi:hypothetical protein